MASTSPSFCRSRGQHEALDLDFVEEPLGELRPDGPVHEPGGEDLLGGRAAFPLEESAGEFARRGHALAIVAGQREEITARLAAGRWPRPPAPRFRRTGLDNCRRPAWPIRRSRGKGFVLRSCVQHVLST